MQEIARCWLCQKLIPESNLPGKPEDMCQCRDTELQDALSERLNELETTLEEINSKLDALGRTRNA